MPVSPSSLQNRHQRLLPPATLLSALAALFAAATPAQAQTHSPQVQAFVARPAWPPLPGETPSSAASRILGKSASKAVKAPSAYAKVDVLPILGDFLSGLTPDKYSDPLAVASALTTETGSFAAVTGVSPGFNHRLLLEPETFAAHPRVLRMSSVTCLKQNKPPLVAYSALIGEMNGLTLRTALSSKLGPEHKRINRFGSYLSKDGNQSGVTIALTGDPLDMRWVAPSVQTPQGDPSQWSALRSLYPVSAQTAQQVAPACQHIPANKSFAIKSALTGTDKVWSFSPERLPGKLAEDASSLPYQFEHSVGKDGSPGLNLKGNRADVARAYGSLVSAIEQQTDTAPWTSFQTHDTLVSLKEGEQERETASQGMATFRMGDSQELIVIMRADKERGNLAMVLRKASF